MHQARHHLAAHSEPVQAGIKTNVSMETLEIERDECTHEMTDGPQETTLELEEFEKNGYDWPDRVLDDDWTYPRWNILSIRRRRFCATTSACTWASLT